MIKNEHELNDLLDTERTMPVKIYSDAPIPKGEKYQPILDIVDSGFTFTPRELIHAIGCKVACLPANERDECLKSAYYMTHVLDLEADPLCFKQIHDSDLQTQRSQDVGVGMTCLIASKCYSIPWDQLNSIAAKGKRFDYRGTSNGMKCIFEAKGTKYTSNQYAQVKNGVDKKISYKKENLDIQLVISTCLGRKIEKQKILIADPEFDIDSYAFGDKRDLFYRYRHYARVMQYIGKPMLAKQVLARA